MDDVVRRSRCIWIRRSNLLRSHFDNNVKIAQTYEELEQAFSLVYQEYFRAGYVKKATSSKMILNIYNVLPETRVWIVTSHGTVVSTLTQVFDSHLKLPMDEVYEKELDELRARKRCIVEFSALAIHSEYRWQNILMPLFRNILRHAMACKATDICIAVNPKHMNFYKNILLFEDLGGKKDYPKVNAPSVALRIDLTSAEERFERVYGRMKPDCNLHHYFFRCNGVENLYVKKTFQMTRKMDKNMIEYFFMKKNRILQKLSPHQIEYLQERYPDYDLDQLLNNTCLPSPAR